ncbi:MAG: PhoX family protein [Proteobacteria bacterium]|nr:PhoX family protein [Pseudomonadota bacterium]
MKKRTDTRTALEDPARRAVLRYGVTALGAVAAGTLLAACRNPSRTAALTNRPVELRPSNVEGLLLPDGFTARIIARSGHPVLASSGAIWHGAPDGGAVFSTEDGGWIYVSNSEMRNSAGGASAIRFDATGGIIDAYPILSGTSFNCAGGPTPWNTWLSCEEVSNGRVWECDPYGNASARVLPALGVFMHEAVAVDPHSMRLYLTEDRPDGRLYRFTPSRVENDIPDLESGLLEVAEASALPNGNITWHTVPDPSGAIEATRYQVPESTAFAGGEGAWYAEGVVYFTTKHDNRVWALEVGNNRLTLVYDNDLLADPVLVGVDNVTVSQQGTVYVAEDGGNMQIVAITPQQQVFPVLQILGHGQSEVTGPAFDAGGTRLYFSSQRGATGNSQDGITFEVTGPFN